MRAALHRWTPKTFPEKFWAEGPENLAGKIFRGALPKFFEKNFGAGLSVVTCQATSRICNWPPGPGRTSKRLILRTRSESFALP